ncbi:MAG: pyruvate:ferredoxin (flavodoxin) oxidoreductase [Oscillospiraceae bacterium]|nr:pyruvate:ferredoxin (flavodoxin) oxidoreductase [Oscillospiraceae bacterium]
MARKTKTMDGNTAAAHVSYAFTDVAAIYPITPSSAMADETDKYAAAGRKNIFGKEVKVTEMQSEAGAAGAVHGSLTAGALTTTYTASQGLLLMIPNMYKMAGELLPGVIHVSARAIASHALSIFGDHSDIYACRQTGYAMLCSNSTQEVMDLSTIAHLAAIKGRVPFLHFFDGFRTSHEIQKIKIWDYEDLAKMLDFKAVERFRRNALNPEHPVLRGSAQNDDIFFQAREACNKYYCAVPEIVVDYMNQVNEKIGTNYKPFNYYGDENAERVIIAMGSVCETADEVVDYLNKNGEKVGVIKVRLYRPFVPEYLLNVLPKTVKKISVLDRTKEPGSVGEPLYLDVLAALSESEFCSIPIFRGRYGLSSKDTSPADLIAVFRNMESNSPKKQFTVGIVDDVTNLSLKVLSDPDTTPLGTYSCKFWGLGSDGTVSANKNSIKIIGDYTDRYVQGYFAYDSKKSGGLTVSHLRFGEKPIKSTYYVNKADFVACHNSSYINKYDMLKDLKKGGKFLLNCNWDEKDLDERLSGECKRFIAENDIKFYTIDGVKIAKEIGLGGRINTILQSAFFKIMNIIPPDDAVKYMKDAATKSYGKKGEEVVAKNHAAIDRGMQDIKEIKVPESWKNALDGTVQNKDINTSGLVNENLKKYVNEIMNPVNEYKGNELPVSAFFEHADGSFPQGSSAFEKRATAVDVPEWMPENCIQCNFCSYICPHAVIRPFAMKQEELEAAPEGMKAKAMTGFPDMKFAIAVSALDCTGCGCCVQVCPGFKGNKALAMKSIDSQCAGQKCFDYARQLPAKTEVEAKFKKITVKGSQFKQPMLEFSGACAGCGEPAYAKLATQLFGDKMYIANATGCSSIWGGSAPATPYTTNKEGKGPAWQNSLFEDNAEFGLGMALAQNAIRSRLFEYMEKILLTTENKDLQIACENYLNTKENSELNGHPTEELIKILEKFKEQGDIGEFAKKALKDKDFLAKKSVWIFGGDGWAYDIGFGGLDHVIASGENVNILVFDTEVYSNTGGQSSKASPIGSVAQFAAAGKSVKKKDLGAIAMSYGYVYVAQVSMGADYNQCIKAFVEAENYNGPSIIIAYAPCINHGIKGGMSFSVKEEKQAVEAGYWHLYRFDPRLANEKKNPFILDSKAPVGNFREFILNEVRYNSLARFFPLRAEVLFDKAESDAKDRYDHLLKLSKFYEPRD